MGENCFEFEGKIRNDFSIKLPYLNSCIVPFVSCLDSRSIRGDFVEFWFQRFLSLYIPFQTWKILFTSPHEDATSEVESSFLE